MSKHWIYYYWQFSASANVPLHIFVQYTRENIILLTAEVFCLSSPASLRHVSAISTYLFIHFWDRQNLEKNSCSSQDDGRWAEKIIDRKSNPALHSLIFKNSSALRLQRWSIEMGGIVGKGAEGNSVGKAVGWDVEEGVVEAEGWNNKQKSILKMTLWIHINLWEFVIHHIILCISATIWI